MVSLGENFTPLIPTPKLGLGDIYVKDEGRLPTGSFKARGLCMAISMAKELKIKKVAIPTNGNAGAAMAAYAKRAERSHTFSVLMTLRKSIFVKLQFKVRKHGPLMV